MNTTTTPEDPVPDIDPFSGIDFPTLWIVCLVVIAVFGLVSLCFYWLRGNTYDDRVAWNYGLGMIASGLVSSAAVIVLFDAIFTALLSGVVGLLVIGWLLYAFAQQRSPRGGRW